MEYGYQAEKMSVARRALMLPHTGGIEVSISYAFMECANAFHRMDESGLDDSAREWVTTIKNIMDTSGLEDSAGQGTFLVKARLLTQDQQLELSRAVDELAHWFDRKFWQD